MDLIDRGLAWQAGKLKDHAAKSVVYRRGVNSQSLKVTVGRTLLRLDDGLGGVSVEWTDRDFTFLSDDLSFGEPIQGDQVEETVGGETHYFELLPYSASEPLWVWADGYRHRRKIRTKLVNVV